MGGSRAETLSWRISPDGSRDRKNIRTATDRTALGRVLGEGRIVQGGCECAGAGVFDRDSAAERDGLAAHRAHAGPHGDRHPHALAQDAGIQHALSAGNGPRLDLDATSGCGDWRNKESITETWGAKNS